MPVIEWSERFCLGHQEIDGQHREWVGIINELHYSLLSEDRENIGLLTQKSLVAMYDYVEKHFQFEEAYMLEIGYPDYNEHKRMHDAFRVKVQRLLKGYEENGMSVLNSQLVKVLTNWFEYHILEEDLKIVEFVPASNKV